MYKPDSLKKHLISAIADLRQNPDKLHIFIDEGGALGTGTASLSFRYEYALNLIITDFVAPFDALFVPLIAWLKVNQAEIFANDELRKKAIRFEVDMNNHESRDISITLLLTEAVAVNPLDAGRLDVTHVREPELTPPFDDPFWTLYEGDNLLAEWTTPKAA